jgi:two-component system, chemotaxis family, chemotaxis protein CheY
MASPLASGPEPGSDPASRSSELERLRQPRVVLLDDEPSILRTWKAIMEAHDFEALCCACASDALEAIAAGCDCVITDYHMDDMTGLEVIRAALPLTRAPLILMTADDSRSLRDAALAAGAAGVIAKPVPVLTLIGVIRKVIRG